MEIEAIPTEYCGVTFRSKLEATWGSENLVAKALRQLREQGLVRSVRRGAGAVWCIIEGRQG